jgi:hypothetical protein
MDPRHIRCKDLKRNIPDAFERLRNSETSINPNRAAAVWMDCLQPELPHFQSSGSRPLREIQQTKLDRSNQGSQRKPRACGVRGIMADNNPESTAKRGRGRPRGSGTRGRRVRTGDPRGVVGTPGADKPKAVTGEDICGEGDPISDVPPALVLRPTGSLLLLPKNVSQQITYTE